MRSKGETRPPSWRGAASDADSALRQARQVVVSLERVCSEVRGTGEWGDRLGRLEVAWRLAEGSDGGVLGTLGALGAGAVARPEEATSVCRVLLERLALALALTPVGTPGEVLCLVPEQLREFEVRGAQLRAGALGKACYRVMRSGWLMDDMVVVARPLLEPLEDNDA